MITLLQVKRDNRDHHERLYELMRERSTEEDRFVNISHRALPPFEEHVAFVRAHPYRIWFLLFDDETFVGSLSLTDRNEIGIVLLRAHRGRGIGKAAVKHLMATLKPLPASPSERASGWVANINPRNSRSVRMFNSLGFRPAQVTYIHE